MAYIVLTVDNDVRRKTLFSMMFDGKRFSLFDNSCYRYLRFSVQITYSRIAQRR